MNNLRVNLVQNDAGTDSESNLSAIQDLLSHSSEADLVVLPELFMLRDGPNGQKAAAEESGGRISSWLSQLAKEKGAWVLGGSMLERVDDGIYNTSLLYDPTGCETARYRKIHLFDVDLPDGSSIRESQQFLPGSDPVDAQVAGWRCGLSICYDLRFPELFRRYADLPVDVIFVPANFTRFTGRMHWQPLLQARAIENQCFIIAPNQCGEHPSSGVMSHGHSMVIDPWGKVLAEAGEEPVVVSVDCSYDSLTDVRQRIPALEHRRL